MVIGCVVTCILWGLVHAQYSCSGFSPHSTSENLGLFAKSRDPMQWSNCSAFCPTLHPLAYFMIPKDSHQIYYMSASNGLGALWVSLKYNGSVWVWPDGSIQTANYYANSNDPTVGWRPVRVNFGPRYCGLLGPCCGDTSTAGLDQENCTILIPCACQLNGCRSFLI
jgi:hypothetical protein